MRMECVWIELVELRAELRAKTCKEDSLEMFIVH